MATSDLGDDAVAALEAADRDYRDVQASIEEIGEDTVERVADGVEEVKRLLTRYEGRATGSGGEEFKAFMRMKRELGEFLSELDDDARHREAFEAAVDALDKRRVSESDFERAREALAPARETADLLEQRRTARERYRDARLQLRERLETVESRLADRETVREYGSADLDAPVERLREPIEAHNDAVRRAFETFTHEAPAREVLELVRTTERYPLVEYRQPPEELYEYVTTSEAGRESVATLLEYADHSRSKLAHYVDDPGELKRRVATERTYLTRLSAEPLTVAWPPPPAGELRHRGREIVSVLGRFADDETVERARRVRRLSFRNDYERLRQSAVARDRLTETDRRKLASGELQRELEELRERRDRLRAALQEHPTR